uniref:RING-type E3 ubiquitin transferase n=1 Tax=Oryza sativa subsp. japonica TaxID=39947 RepID=Q6Z6F6_ORYSJ|nr:hypothetical protein [Oryza sativa Japonica Group]BAD17222.1 hypothetical protein [Oryza sativa Japonica Group]
MHIYKISAEITTALLFLHQTKPESLVHRNLKPANILFDRNILLKVLTSPPPIPIVPASPPPPACPRRSAPIAPATVGRTVVRADRCLPRTAVRHAMLPASAASMAGRHLSSPSRPSPAPPPPRATPPPAAAHPRRPRFKLPVPPYSRTSNVKVATNPTTATSTGARHPHRAAFSLQHPDSPPFTAFRAPARGVRAALFSSIGTPRRRALS